MITILSQPKWRGTCQYCETSVEATQKSLRVERINHNALHYPPNLEIKFWVPCPECSSDIQVHKVTPTQSDPLNVIPPREQTPAPNNPQDTAS